MRGILAVSLVGLVACRSHPPSAAVPPGNAVMDPCATAPLYVAPAGADQPLRVVADTSAFEIAEVRFLALCIDGALVMRTDHQELDPHEGTTSREIVVAPGPHHVNVVVRAVSSARQTAGYTLLIRSPHDFDATAVRELRMELYDQDGEAFQDRARVRWKP